MNKTISFDLWGTLIKANPLYSTKRIEIIKKYNNDLTNEQITSTLKEVKKDFDYLVEKYGVQHDNNTIYSAILTKLNIDIIHWKSIQKELNDAFISNPPLYYDNNIIKVLLTLILADYELILISNTLLISGDTLSKALPDLMYYFNSEFYSDEQKLSKPNINLFKHCYDNQIIQLHVGDNEITDIKGATNYGIKSLLINGNTDKTIIDVLSFLNIN